MTTDYLQIYGVFDIGSNSVRALVYKNGETLFKALVTTRLGEGLTATGKLSDEAISRTLSGIGSLFAKVLAYSPAKIYAFATEAVRSAKNGGEFIKAVKANYGIDAEILSGEEEGEIGLLGAIGKGDGGIIDIGGASAEITAARNGKVVYSHSLPLGAVRLKDMCGESEAELDKAISARINEYGRVPDVKYFAIGGTATSLCACFLGLEKYDGDKVNGTVMSLEQVSKTYSEIKSLTVKERTDKLHINAKRAEIIVGGVYLLQRIMHEFSIGEITVSENDNMLGFLKKRVFKECYERK